MDVRHLVIVSDLHCGCQLGLCPDRGFELDDGGTYYPSDLQVIVWHWWREFWNDWVPSVVGDEPYAVCVNGDAIEGTHHRVVTPITTNIADQERLAYDVLWPVVQRCDGRYFHVRGTPAHVGPSGQSEERLARMLEAVPDDTGRHARYELWIRLGGDWGPLCHVTHHIGTTSTIAYEATALQKELVNAYVECLRWGDEPPRVIVRSHRHRFFMTHVGQAVTLTTPGWQLRTPFTYRKTGAIVGRPQIGGVVLTATGDASNPVQVHHKVWGLRRGNVA